RGLSSKVNLTGVDHADGLRPPMPLEPDALHLPLEVRVVLQHGPYLLESRCVANGDAVPHCPRRTAVGHQRRPRRLGGGGATSRTSSGSIASTSTVAGSATLGFTTRSLTPLPAASTKTASAGSSRPVTRRFGPRTVRCTVSGTRRTPTAALCSSTGT